MLFADLFLFSSVYNAKNHMSQESIKKEYIQSELSRLIRNNQDLVPIYIVINSQDPLEAKQPITMCLKTSKFKECIEQTRKKHPQYPLIYIFGKQSKHKDNDGKGVPQNERLMGKGTASKSQRRKEKKLKSRQTVEAQVIQQFIPITESMQDLPIQTIYNQYQDDYGLLVLAISKVSLIKQAKTKKSEVFLIVLAIVFGLLFLYLTLAQPGSATPKPQTENDYII